MRDGGAAEPELDSAVAVAGEDTGPAWIPASETGDGGRRPTGEMGEVRLRWRWPNVL